MGHRLLARHWCPTSLAKCTVPNTLPRRRARAERGWGTGCGVRWEVEQSQHARPGEAWVTGSGRGQALRACHTPRPSAHHGHRDHSQQSPARHPSFHTKTQGGPFISKRPRPPQGLKPHCPWGGPGLCQDALCQITERMSRLSTETKK